MSDPHIRPLQQPDGLESGSYESFFRAPDLIAETPLAWALERHLDVLEAIRGLMTGGPAVARLRVWAFLELAGHPLARFQRDDVNQLLHVLRTEVLEATLKRLRDLGLLVWEAATQDYHLSSLAQQVQAILSPLTRAASDDDEMSTLLAQVAGAQTLGLSDPGQIGHLHAQLVRLRDDFADAIASGSEARLREAQPRFERALRLVERAGEALTALIRSEHDDPRLEREARKLGKAQAELISMASQFTRALQQTDRQRVTLGSTGITSSDVRDWLRTRTNLHELMGESLHAGVVPIFISQHEILDVAEAELEKERQDADRVAELPPPAVAAAGGMETLRMPAELGEFIGKLSEWGLASDDHAVVPRKITEAVLGGRYAQAAYRMQLLPLLGDAQARTLAGETGDFARASWQVRLTAQLWQVDDEHVSQISAGHLVPDNRQA